MAVLVYLIRFIISGSLVESITPSGPVHTVLTVTGTSTAGLNTTVQVRVTSDPTGRIGEAGILVIFIELGAGTIERRDAWGYPMVISLLYVHCIVTSNSDILIITVHNTFAIHNDITSIASCIRQSQRRERESWSSS